MIRYETTGSEPVTRRVEPDGEKADVRKQIVCTQRWADRIEDWRRQQPGRIPTWSEAVRILVEQALDAEGRGNGKR